jgi:hypothetical protein
LTEHATLRLVKNDDEEPTPPVSEPDELGPRKDKPLPLGLSMLVWLIMAGLAWAVIAAVLHFL